MVGSQPVKLGLDELREAVLRLKLVKGLEFVRRMIHYPSDIKNEVRRSIILSCRLTSLLGDIDISTGLTVHYINY